MILTMLISLLLFLSLWPFFIWLDVMNFKKSENAMEDHLPGRPARRTVGRKNEDVLKSIFGIVIFYVILCSSIYGLPNLGYLISPFLILIGVTVLSGLAVYFVTPFNRLAHAYATMGQISVIHLCSSLSVFLLTSAILHQNYLTIEKAVTVLVMVLGAMMITSRKQTAR